jgi:hypothetical protein
MAITGHLAEFSLAEILQFLEQGHKTGLLTIFALPEAQPPNAQTNHYIWFNQGNVVAAANRSDHRGLIALISQRGWLGDRAVSRLAQTCAPKTPLGLCLKSQGLLQAEQLKLLFYTQVMRQICALFSLPDGWFHFDSKAVLPLAEMTGLSAQASEVTLSGLRALKDWSALMDKLPEASSSLVAVKEGKPSLRLNQLEWAVWEFTNGNLSLKAIAQQLQVPLEKIQQAAFRLMVVGLVEEVPMIEERPPLSREADPDPLDDGSLPETMAQSSGVNTVSQSFLHNLMGFLKGHAG